MVDKRLCEAKTDQSERGSRFERGCSHPVDGCRPSRNRSSGWQGRTFL